MKKILDYMPRRADKLGLESFFTFISIKREFEATFVAISLSKRPQFQFLNVSMCLPFSRKMSQTSLKRSISTSLQST